MQAHDDSSRVRAGGGEGWAWHHAGLVVADLDTAIDYYHRALGFELEFRVDGMSDQFQRTVGLPEVSCDLAQLVAPFSATRLELIRVYNVPSDAPAALPVHVGIGHGAYQVSNLEASLAALVSAGGAPIGEIVEFSEGPAVYCWTPAGTVIELEEPWT